MEPMNHNVDHDSVSLSSPKGGEGRGEEALRVHGEIHWVLDVRCSQVVTAEAATLPNIRLHRPGLGPHTPPNE